MKTSYYVNYYDMEECWTDCSDEFQDRELAIEVAQAAVNSTYASAEIEQRTVIATVTRKVVTKSVSGGKK